VNQSKEGPLFCLDEQMIDKAAKALDEIENGRRYRAIPRAYIVFRMLGQLDLLDKLLKQKITDHWFPVGEGGFPSLIEPRLRSAILEFQSLILTKTVHFEKAKHHHFGSADDIWKLFTKNGGKLGYSHIQAGDVFPVTLKVSSEVYALKRLSRNKNAGPDLNIMERLVNELTALKNLTHRHIVQYIGSYTDPASFGLLISPVAEQDLATLLESITSNGTFQGHATELRQYYGCLVGALCYVHSRNIKHKDIKPENILIKGKTVLLTDFGISRAFSTLDGSATIGPTSKDFRYCAREVFTEKTRNRKSDIWSLGCVFLEILSVLKGLSPKKIQTFFNNVGDCELSYHKNIEAVGELLRKFETRDSKLGSEEIDCTWLNPNSTLDNDALYWITRMLRDDPKTRPDAAKVFRWTTTKMAESTPPTTFCGACCFDEGRDIWLTDEESDSQQDQVHSKVTLSSAVYSNYPTSLQSHKTYPRSSLQINESSMVSGYPEPVQSPSGFPFHEVSDTSMYTMQLSVHSYALYTSPDHLKNATINPDASVFGQEGDTTPQRYPSWGIENAKKVDGHASSIAQNAPRKPRHNSRKSYNVRALNSLVLRSSDGVPPAEDELFTKGLRNAIKRTNMPCSIPTTTGYQFYLDHLPFLVSKCGSMLRGKGKPRYSAWKIEDYWNKSITQAMMQV
jgi:serine/threonine protein kinase